MLITSLKPRVRRHEAVERFRGRLVTGLVRTWQRGSLVQVRDVYIPYRLFEVRVLNRGEENIHWLALDAVAGTLDLYRLESIPAEDQLLQIETMSAVQPRLPPTEARQIVIERTRRLVYLSGFFRLRDLRIQAEEVGLEFHVPYWVGLYRKGNRASIEVIDALRNQLEGAKVRDLISQWL